MPNISLKIAYPIIIAGLFIMVAFIALNYQSLSTNFYIIFSFLILYIFLFGFATGQNFARPVKKLLKTADSLSKGDLKSRSYLEGKDELAQLAHMFNRIAEQLEQTHVQNETIQKSVDFKVQSRTQALEETINALEQKVRNRTIENQRTAADMEKMRERLKMSEAEANDLKIELEGLRQKMEKPPRQRKPKLAEPAEELGNVTQEET